MTWILGLLFFLASIAMVVVARPRRGVSAPFVEVWELGWIYALAVTFGLVIGIALFISDWPLR